MTLEDTYPLSKTHKKRVRAYLTHAGHGKKTKSGMGGECIVTLTGWTHPLHTNTKRKCVSILCIPETSLSNP